MKKRMIENYSIRVADRDFYFLITRKSDGFRLRHKTTSELRAAMSAKSLFAFEKIMDRAIENINRRKYLREKNELELVKIQEAAKNGVPIEDKIYRPDPQKPAVRVLSIMPWYRRVWRWAKLKMGLGVAVVKTGPTKKGG